MHSSSCSETTGPRWQDEYEPEIENLDTETINELNDPYGSMYHEDRSEESFDDDWD